MNKLDFTYDELWRSRMLASIGHALFVANAPDEAYSNSWDGITNNIPNGQGDNAAITFHPEFVVGAFYCHESARLTDYKEALEYLQDAPKQVKDIAKEETLQFLLGDASYFESGCEQMTEDFPVITTAFWGTREGLFSLDTQEELVENGVFEIEKELEAIQSDELISKWAEEKFEFTQEQIGLLISLYHRKITKPFGVIVLTEQEIQVIACNDVEGFNESKNLFEQIGVILDTSLIDSQGLASEDDNDVLTQEEIELGDANLAKRRTHFAGYTVDIPWMLENEISIDIPKVIGDMFSYDDEHFLVFIENKTNKKIGIISEMLGDLVVYQLDPAFCLRVHEQTKMIFIFSSEDALPEYFSSK